MSNRGFVYFVNEMDQGAVKKDKLRALKIPVLEDADNAELTGRSVMAGRFGAGQLIWISRPSDKYIWALKGDGQVWRKIPKEVSGALVDYWIGWMENEAPCPLSLQRKDMIPGEHVKLGQEMWQVPHARMFPRVFGLGDAGPTWKPMPRYDEIFNQLERYLRVWLGEEEPPPDPLTWSAELCATVLGLNYYVGKAELAALEVLDTQLSIQVLYAALDLNRLLEEAKKNEAASPTA